MNLLDRVERRLEQLVEGAFSKAFKAAPHPVDVARALARLMDERAIISLSRTYAPNEFQVTLNPQEFEIWSAVAAAIAGEIQAYLTEHAAERQYASPAPVHVTLAPDEAVPSGTFRMEATLRPPAPNGEAPLGPGGDEKETAIFEPPDARRLRRVLVSPDGARHVLPPGPATLGRGEVCAIVLDDPAASREHARIEPSTDGPALVDLDSKNGTYVNGERIGRHVLRPGDRIRVGSTTLDFRLEEP